MGEFLQSVQRFVLSNGADVILAVLLAAAGWLAATWAARAVRRVTMRSERIDPTLAPILVNAVRIAILIATGMAVLDRLGVDTASLLAVLGAIGIGVGLALKDTLADVAAGVVILVLRPFDVGDDVSIDGESGHVVAIDIFETKLVDGSGVPFVLPNAKVRVAKISNYSRAIHRRCELVIGIEYEASVLGAVEVLEAALARQGLVLAQPAPTVTVDRLGDSAVELKVRFFVAPGDVAIARGQVAAELKVALDAAGIGIPYPQRVVHVHQASPTGNSTR